MTAAGNAPQRRFTGSQLATTGLVLLIIGAGVGGLYVCKSASNPMQGVATGSDTPIVISGGSVRLRAKGSDWATCDGSAASTSTTCYKAPFNNNKAQVKYFQYLDKYITPIAIPSMASAPSVTTGWEIDVVDTNPDNKHMVLVCAQANSNFTACDHNAINTSDTNIYVIAAGGGSFDLPKLSGKYKEKIMYHDGNTQYDFIGTIKFFPSQGSEVDEACGTASDSNCTAYLSKTEN